MIRAGSTWLVWLLPIALSAADWPQWRGSNRDGVSPESVEPWQGPLPVLWRQAVGEGHSSPVVAGGRVFIHAKVHGEEKEELIAYEAATGKRMWRSEYERTPFKSEYGSGPRATPLVDGDRVYTLGVSGNLICREAAGGKQLWQTDILKEFHAQNLFFGVSSSPVIDGDKLLVMVGGPEASIVAFDKVSGKVVWKSGSDKATYASPIITTFNNHKLAVFLTHDGVTALDPADGKRFWQFPLVDRLAESSTTPVRVGDILFASSVTFGSVELKLTTQNGHPGYDQLWKEPKLTCYFSTPVAVGEHLYAVTGHFLPLPGADLHCVEAKTGKILWTRKNVGKYHATVMRAKDRILLLEEEGDLALVEPNPQSYKELARTKVCGHTWAHPALGDGRLFVRDEKEIICLQMVKPANAAQEPATLQDKVDRIVTPFLDQKKVVGLVVGVIDKDGRRVFGYGKLAADSDKKPNGDTIFEIGSITKVFTALLLADMAEQGPVSLDDPVQKYLPDSVKVPRANEKEITLLHLATHTSGLPRVPILLTLRNLKNPYAAISAKDIYDFLGACKLIHDPGDKFDYSNLGGGLLGHVLARRANQSYEDLVVQRIAAPLAMKDTRITLSPAQRERLAPGHTADCKPTGTWEFDALAGCGALRSTANDLLTFAAANLGFTETKLAPALAACQQPRHEVEGPVHVGLGWMISNPPDGNAPFVWHNGGTGGYNAFLGFNKQKGFGVVVMTNTALSLKGAIADQVAIEVAKELAAGK